MDSSTARVVGGIYLALCQGLSDQGVALANDILYSLADTAPPQDAKVLRLIANASVNGAPLEEQPEFRRMTLRIVDDGAA